MLDVVYVLRSGENHELRYSLRSLENFPHRQVWTVGGKPDWLTATNHIDTPIGGTKYVSSANNLRTAVHTPEISDDFYLFNDDFFVIQPLTRRVPNLNRGPLIDILNWYERKYPAGFYTRGMRNTYDLLVSLGHNNPMSYELHTPFKVNKAEAARLYKTLDRMFAQGKVTRPLHWRTIYGNRTHAGGTPTNDVKVYRRRTPLPDGPYVSTNDVNFRKGLAGLYIRRRFPDPSPYENPGG